MKTRRKYLKHKTRFEPRDEIVLSSDEDLGYVRAWSYAESGTEHILVVRVTGLDGIDKFMQIRVKNERE